MHEVSAALVIYNRGNAEILIQAWKAEGLSRGYPSFAPFVRLRFTDLSCVEHDTLGEIDMLCKVVRIVSNRLQRALIDSAQTLYDIV